jgi:hypothetical protein
MSGPLALTRSRVAALVVAGVVAGGVGGVVISQLGVATASSPSPKPSAGVPFRHGPGGMGLGLLGPMGAGRMLHGEATLAKQGGGTVVVRFQNGTISDISGSTITVKSTDGFTSTFTVDGTTRITLNGTDGTLSKLAKNDKVRVVGVQNGSSTVAKMVLDGVPPRGMFGGGGLGELRQRFEHRMPMQPMQPGSPGQAG